ncbi:hypothetical protein FPV67DRAFT_1449488 [Lyophyllum atratum]|nr:hypothetical protein FPV67DRAFT_1449488 [Lyophyllum atratum]
MPSDVQSPNSDVLLYILAIILPPVAVFLTYNWGTSERGLAADFWINVLLTILGWIPGIAHAWTVCRQVCHLEEPRHHLSMIDTTGASKGASASNNEKNTSDEKPHVSFPRNW